MELLSLTVMGIAAATAVGIVLGDRMGRLQGKWAVAARYGGMVLLAVILLGVLVPMLERGSGIGPVLLVLGLMCCLEALGERLEGGARQGSGRRLRSLSVAAVIVLHHFPEGMAAGLRCVSGGAGAWAVCGAVVLHSIPETMVMLPIMADGGFSKAWGYAAATLSGLSIIFGLLLGAAL